MSNSIHLFGLDAVVWVRLSVFVFAAIVGATYFFAKIRGVPFRANIIGVVFGLTVIAFAAVCCVIVVFSIEKVITSEYHYALIMVVATFLAYGFWTVVRSVIEDLRTRGKH